MVVCVSVYVSYTLHFWDISLFFHINNRICYRFNFSLTLRLMHRIVQAIRTYTHSLFVLCVQTTLNFIHLFSNLLPRSIWFRLLCLHFVCCLNVIEEQMQLKCDRERDFESRGITEGKIAARWHWWMWNIGAYKSKQVLFEIKPKMFYVSNEFLFFSVMLLNTLYPINLACLIIFSAFFSLARAK